MTETDPSASPASPTNPLLAPSDRPYELPPFDLIATPHYPEAFEVGMAAQLDEIAAIVAAPEPATFANTIDAMERSGQVLDRAAAVFYNRVGSDTDPELQQIEADWAPRFAAHSDAILLDTGLFARIDDLYQRRDDLDLTPEQLQVLTRYHLGHVRAGAGLSEAEQDRLREINAELATLSTTFGSNLLADTNDLALHVESEAELAGMSADAIGAARAAAESRGLDGFLITLVLPTHQPALESLQNRDARRRLYEAAQSRGRRGNEHDTTDILRRMVVLRAERAELMGYENHASYVLADQTAGSLQRLDDMLHRLIPAAVANAQAEAQEREQRLRADGVEDELRPWDWAYYSEQIKRERYSFDAAELRPYFPLESVVRHGAFAAATALYGITFTERPELPGYHPQARVFEVHDADGGPLGLFVGDWFTRDSKRGGAWMNSLVTQSKLLGQLPVVVNNLNIPQPPEGRPALLTLDEVRTVFHEFGHALHGLFSDVTYPRVAGTAVSRDFVEYPSQVNEMWAEWPDVLGGYARHVETGDPLPAELVERIAAAETFNEGFETCAYLAATWLDQCWHRLSYAEAMALTESVEEFEHRVLGEVGLDLPVVDPRYRTTYFRHIFDGGYSAGYYSYIWSEVLDADTVAWFRESGGLRRELGDTFRTAVLSRGRSRPELDCFVDFRGREPDMTPLLVRRGLT